jgi:hypothetical protein
MILQYQLSYWYILYVVLYMCNFGTYSAWGQSQYIPSSYQMYPILSNNVKTANKALNTCPAWKVPLAFGGAASAEISLQEAYRWKQFRYARERERMYEAYRPHKVYQQYRIEQDWIDQGCIKKSDLIDLGRALFLRRFTRAEGFGHGNPNRVQRTPLHTGNYGGPDASACVDCHWKGGFAGAGDRVDNVLSFGDGDDIQTQEVRNPLALWGSGWVEILAREMSSTLQKQAKKAHRKAIQIQKSQRIELIVQNIPFGWLTVHVDGSWSTDELEGIDIDLQIKPFGWKGVFPSIRSFVTVSAHKHFGLQAEELLAEIDPHVDLGNGTTNDPDEDQIQRELTVGQITALVAFVATLDVPQMILPQTSMKKEPIFIGENKPFAAGEFMLRWQKGSQIFEEIGCSGCHVPFLKIKKPMYPIGIPHLNQPIHAQSQSQSQSQSQLYKSHILWLDLSKLAAKPRAQLTEDGSYLLPVFSDFKRHKMGKRLRSLYSERGVKPDTYLTRRLWGFSNTSPYLHTGTAFRLSSIIKQHGGEGSEALYAAEAFFALSSDEKSSVRVFLASLRRASSIRIR